MNFYDQDCTFESVLFVFEKLKSYINFSDQDLRQLEAEFLSLQSITLDYKSEEALKEAAICHGGEEHAVIYRIDVLWYHLSIQKIPGTSWTDHLEINVISTRIRKGSIKVHENTTWKIPAQTKAQAKIVTISRL